MLPVHRRCPQTISFINLVLFAGMIDFGHVGLNYVTFFLRLLKMLLVLKRLITRGHVTEMGEIKDGHCVGSVYVAQLLQGLRQEDYLHLSTQVSG